MTTMTSSTFAFARYPDLAGVSVLVSGGASGIGEWIVRGYAEQGAKVGFVDLDRQAGDQLAAELGGSSAVRFEVCDITDTTAYRAAIGRIAAAHGPVRVLINNAANDDRHDWRDVTPEAFDRAAAVNLRHAFFAIQAVAPAMIDAGGGAIVNLGSIGWMTATAGYPVYAASKAAAHGLTRAFARELGQHAIRVNTLVPGWTMTPKAAGPAGQAAGPAGDRRQSMPRRPRHAMRCSSHGGVPRLVAVSYVFGTELHRRRRLGLTPRRDLFIKGDVPCPRRTANSGPAPGSTTRTTRT